MLERQVHHSIVALKILGRLKLRFAHSFGRRLDLHAQHAFMERIKLSGRGFSALAIFRSRALYTRYPVFMRVDLGLQGGSLGSRLQCRPKELPARVRFLQYLPCLLRSRFDLAYITLHNSAASLRNGCAHISRRPQQLLGIGVRNRGGLSGLAVLCFERDKTIPDCIRPCPA